MARSTCSSPSTSRRTFIPRSYCSSAIAPPRAPPARVHEQLGRAQVRAWVERRRSRRGARRPRRSGACRSGRPASDARWAAAVTTAFASGRSSRIATASVITSPPVRSRLARIRSACTSSPSSASARAAAAPPVNASARDSASHSACQAPAARSCSCACAAISTDAAPRTPCAHDRQRRADRVALVRQRRRPAAAPGRRLGQLPHLGLRHQLHVERDLLDRPAVRARAAPSCPIRSRRVCQGSTGSAGLELGGDRRQQLDALVAEGSERARGRCRARPRAARRAAASERHRSRPSSRPP